jgi:STE24 endopeptidase
MPAAETDFSPAEVDRARRYHRPLYVAFAVEAALALAVAAAYAFTGPGERLAASLASLPWWAVVLVLAGAVLVTSFLVRLPLTYWRGHIRERRYGFSTQTSAGWLADRSKALAVRFALAAVPLVALVGLARALPAAWPAVVAPGAALLVVLLGLVAPVVLEPIFNRFRPLDDETLGRDLRELSVRAGVPVERVLVADASRRTRRENAYVSGIGRTRRVVLYDTLLARAAPRELRLIAAHELAHRRERHVVKGALLGALGAAASVLVLWALLRSEPVLEAIGADGAGDPRIVPFALLMTSALELAVLPAAAWLSRRWERVADRGSLELTRDPEGFVDAFLALARANLSDLDPPRLAYACLFSHPTPPERIASARAWQSRYTAAVTVPDERRKRA